MHPEKLSTNPKELPMHPEMRPMNPEEPQARPMTQPMLQSKQNKRRGMRRAQHLRCDAGGSQNIVHGILCSLKKHELPRIPKADFAPEGNSRDVARQHYADTIRQYIARRGGSEGPSQDGGEAFNLDLRHRHRLWPTFREARLRSSP